MNRNIVWSILTATVILCCALILAWVGNKGVSLRPANGILMLVAVPALVCVYVCVGVYPPSSSWLVANGHSPPTGLLFWICFWVIAFIESLVVLTLWRRARRARVR